jgi:hypothetical protein
VNYAVAGRSGPRVFSAEDRQGLLHRMLNRHHLAEAHASSNATAAWPSS